MGLERGKPRQLPAVARTEITYLDIKGKPTKPETALRIVTREYDAQGNFIMGKLFIDYSRGH